jgi:prepilin-type N-terminal cleavage/methylation domain-containing protein/prepilin-type processing-associated H-X9-DG protein
MPETSSRGFTLIELLVVMLTIAILASFAYSSYTGAQGRARITQDMNNLRQIGLAMQTYLNDNDQVVPASPTWPGTTATPVLYPKYIGTRKVYQSPLDKRPSLETDAAPVSYGINANMYAANPGINGNMAAVVSASSTIFIAPNYTGNPTNPASWTGTASNAPALPVGAPAETSGPQSNGQQINALFCDLHVETLSFGPATKTGSFQDKNSDPLGLKHWDPTK